MPTPRAKLRDIVDAIEGACEMATAYFDRQTGSVVVITEEDQHAATDDEVAARAPAWQKEAIDDARAIEADEEGRFVGLPSQFDAHEWNMMAGFVATVTDLDANDRLSVAIRGRGAFRMFKDTAARLGLLDQWYAFRDARYRDLAREWCKENEIETEEDA